MTDSRPTIKTRERTRVISKYDWTCYWTDGRSYPEYPKGGQLQLTDQQKTTSEGHSWPPPKTAKYDVGGNFLSERHRVLCTPSPIDLSVSPWWAEGASKVIKGYHWYPGDAPGLQAKPSDSQMDAWGTTAIARVEPTRAPADVSTMFGELFREGLPSLTGVHSWKNRTQLAKSAGGEYLNIEFGWKPLVSDIRKFSHAVKNAKRILKQYERDAGKVVRRGYDFPLVESVEDVRQITSYGVPLTSFSSDFGGEVVLSTEIRRSERKWFSGAFTYYIQPSNSHYAKLDEYVKYADHILGLELTPEVIWNLTPWSWAIDWFSNVGDILHNVSAFTQDSLVMRYGYIMCHQKSERINLWSPPAYINGTQGLAGSWRYISERKMRRKATPFGFGTNLGNLSDYQWSILAALGLTRGQRRL